MGHYRPAAVAYVYEHTVPENLLWIATQIEYSVTKAHHSVSSIDNKRLDGTREITSITSTSDCQNPPSKAPFLDYSQPKNQQLVQNLLASI